MAFNIQNFISATQAGLAREAHFELLLTLPNGVPGNARQLSILCASASVPQKNADITKIRRSGHGLLSPYVVGMNFTPLNLSFYCDAEADTINIFQKWMENMMSLKTSTVYQLQYKEAYQTTVILNQYNSAGNIIATYKFYTAFPSSVGPINFSWAARNSLVLVPVTFEYTYYEMIKIGTTQTPGAVPTNSDSDKITVGPTNSPPSNPPATRQTTSPFTPGGGGFGGGGATGNF